MLELSAELVLLLLSVDEVLTDELTALVLVVG